MPETQAEIPVPDASRAAPRGRDRRRSLLVQARYHFAAAALLSLVWLALELAGQRENVAFLSGTRLDPEQVLFGTVYLFGWFGFVLVAPVFAIAGLATAASHWAADRSPWARQIAVRARDLVATERSAERTGNRSA
jgi:thiosulfate reductase cytochrome b subunit